MTDNIQIGALFAFRNNKRDIAEVVGYDKAGIPLLESRLDKQIYRYNADRWNSYTEPLTIQRYAYIVQLENGEFVMDSSLYRTESDARNDAMSHSNWDSGRQKLIEIIPVTWKEPR